MLLGLTEKISLELGFKRRKCLSMADDKGKTVPLPGDRANVRKDWLLKYNTRRLQKTGNTS